MLLVFGGRYAVVVQDLKTRQSKTVMSADPDKRIDPSWCGWANATRLLCGFKGVASEDGQFYPYSRLVAVNADSSDLKMLYQRQTFSAFDSEMATAQFQDEVIDWTPDDPDTVLMAIDDNVDTFPGVFAVNVYTGKRKTVVSEHPRNSELYRCAISIAGVSDLPEMLNDEQHFVTYQIDRKQVGTDRAKLKADSPRRHADGVNVPILMVHGDHDYTVTVEQTHLMESALKKAGKRYKTVIIKDADHQLPHDADRQTLYTELDAFLKAELGPGIQ